MNIEINKTQMREDLIRTSSTSSLMITPPIDENYWLLRVPLSEKQAIVAFPKFLTVGCGFQHEEDWNTNLPLSCDTNTIFNHIAHNKGDDNITDDDCKKAIDLIRTEAIKIGLLEAEEAA